MTRIIDQLGNIISLALDATTAMQYIKTHRLTVVHVRRESGVSIVTVR
jgi:hypothetical protein